MLFKFTSEEHALMAGLSNERNAPKVKAGVRNYRVGVGDDLSYHLRGVKGEMAFAKVFGVPFHQLPGLATDGRRPDYIVNGVSFHVKARSKIADCVIVPKRLHPLPDDCCIVCLKEAGPDIEFVGFISGRDFRENARLRKFPPNYIDTPAVPFSRLAPIWLLMHEHNIPHPGLERTNPDFYASWEG